LATPSTVPTWAPSAPITSMFWAILSVVIWSLVSPIALELGVLCQAEPCELPTRVRREEIPVSRASGKSRGGVPATSRKSRLAKRTGRT
jgi:hypothetical protein